MFRTSQSKWVPFGRLADLSARLKQEGRRIVTTNGCFDLLHLGHIQYLEEARRLGDLLICGINSDRSVKALKGPSRPLYSEDVRALQLAGLESVDFVTVFDESTPERMLDMIKPTLHVKGGDYLAEDLPERAVVEKGGGKVVCVKLIEGFSTTRLIERILASPH